MLLFILLGVGVVIFLALIGFAISMIFLSRDRVQIKAEAVALNLANVLNASDRAGTMNNFVCWSRELVFLSRKAHRRAVKDYKHLEPLARQLVDEARSGAQTLELERRELLDLELNEIDANIENQLAERSSGMALPGIKVQAPKVLKVKTGYIDGVLSNARIAYGVPGLARYDLDRKFVDEDTGLFFGNINAVLPGQDSDLKFKISSLPTAVKGTIAPARITSEKIFRVDDANDQLPSAVQIEMVMKMINRPGKGNAQPGLKPAIKEVLIHATAAATGASPVH